MRARVQITYEYDVVPEHYPEEMQGDLSEMVKLDIETDPAATLFENNWKIIATEVFPGYQDAGFGCKACGCRPAKVGCEDKCIPCYRKDHPGEGDAPQ